MIYIVHGENLSASRTTILNLQKKLGAESKIEVLLSETNPQNLLEICSSFDIFSKPPFIVLDISLAGRTDLDKYIAVIKKIPTETTLTILTSKALPKTNAFIKTAANLKATVLQSRSFQNSNIFRFADLVFSGNRNATYRELNKLIQDAEDPFYIFSMLLYNLRNIAYAKFNSPSFNKIAPFAKEKSKVTAEKFAQEALIKLYKNFYAMDRDVKSGTILGELLIPLAVERVFAARV